MISFLHPESSEEDERWIAMTAICIPVCTFNLRSGPDSGWPAYTIEAKPLSATGVSRENALRNLHFAVEEAVKALKEAQADEIAV